MDLLDSEHLIELLKGLRITVLLFAIAWTMSFGLALVLVVLRATEIRPLQWFVDAFVAYHRNVPSLVHVMFWYFGIPEILPDAVRFWLYDHNAEMSLAAIALALGSAAYVSEDIRSGLRAIPATQFEAANALGCSYLQTMRYVIIPQTLRISLPPLVNRALLLFKNTSIAMAIGVAELTYRAREIENQTFKTFAVFGVATALYLLGTFLIMAIGSYLERRSRISIRRVADA